MTLRRRTTAFSVNLTLLVLAFGVAARAESQEPSIPLPSVEAGKPGRPLFRRERSGIDRALWASQAGRTVVEITIDGLKHTREIVARREIETRVGDPLGLDRLEADLQRLVNLGIFSKVDVAVEGLTDGGLRLRFSLSEATPVLLYPAIRYREADGFSAGVGAAAINLAGRAVSLGGRAMLAGPKANNINFEWPWITGNHLFVRANWTGLDVEDEILEYREDSKELKLEAGGWIGRAGRLKLGFDALRLQADEPGITLDPEGTDSIRRLYLAIGLDTRDSWRTPGSGWLNEIQLTRAGGWLGGDGDWHTLDVDLRRYARLAGTSARFVFGALGSFQTGEVGVDLPTYLEYRIGGANSVRGYDPISTPQTHAGKNQLLGTVEMALPLRPIEKVTALGLISYSVGLELVVFADAGIAWSEGPQFAMNNTIASAGFGLRLPLPKVESLRIDFAAANGAPRLHFAMGTKFNLQRQRLR